MGTQTNQIHSIVDSTVYDGEELLKALDALQPADSQKKIALFGKIYPGIVRAISRKVPQKDILDMLKRTGLKLNPVRYRAMLEEEQKLRNEKGDRICCDKCGAFLSSEQETDLPEGGKCADAENLSTDKVLKNN